MSCFFTPTSNQVTIINFIFKLIIFPFLPFQSQDSSCLKCHQIALTSALPLPRQPSHGPSSEITSVLKSFMVSSSLIAQCPNFYVRPLTSWPQHFSSYSPCSPPNLMPQLHATISYTCPMLSCLIILVPILLAPKALLPPSLPMHLLQRACAYLHVPPL